MAKLHWRNAKKLQIGCNILSSQLEWFELLNTQLITQNENGLIFDSDQKNLGYNCDIFKGLESKIETIFENRHKDVF